MPLPPTFRRIGLGLAPPPYKLKLKLSAKLRSSKLKLRSTSKRAVPALRAAARFIPYGVRAAAVIVSQFPSIFGILSKINQYIYTLGNWITVAAAAWTP